MIKIVRRFSKPQKFPKICTRRRSSAHASPPRVRPGPRGAALAPRDVLVVLRRLRLLSVPPGGPHAAAHRLPGGGRVDGRQRGAHPRAQPRDRRGDMRGIALSQRVPDSSLNFPLPSFCPQASCWPACPTWAPPRRPRRWAARRRRSPLGPRCPLQPAQPSCASGALRCRVITHVPNEAASTNYPRRIDSPLV